MRFALLAFSAAALAAVTGCSSSPPPVADGAWFVSLVSDTGNCGLSDIMAHTGLVDGNSKQQVISDGMMNTSITCSVTQNSDMSFAVQATGTDTSATGSTLEIQLASLTSGASMTSPATGGVTFISPGTANNQFVSESCSFYFESKSEGVDLGQVWVSFNCPMLTHGSTDQVCNLSQGVAIFENCATQ